MLEFITVASLLLCTLSAGYMLLAIARVVLYRRKLAAAVKTRPTEPVTLLKPISGLEVELAENLGSFCRQDYADYQIVFGVQDSTDPAIPVIRKIMEEFPDRDIALVVGGESNAVNRKVANLTNMMPAARHDILVVSDSDMRIPTDYIRVVTAPFVDVRIGATTCLYTGTPKGGLASKLGAMYINDSFLPSCLIALGFSSPKFCFGATMAVRREVLEGFGGFAKLGRYIADDYMLGRLTLGRGRLIALAPCLVENIVHERNLRALFLHELRWARTIRSVQPLGYALSFITELLPLAVVAAALLWTQTQSWQVPLMLLASALAIRYCLHHAVTTFLGARASYFPWAIPLRDFFSVIIRITSFCGRQVHWREQVYTLQPDSVSER